LSVNQSSKSEQPVRSAYQPPANSTFLSEQTSHRQPVSSNLLSEQTSTSQPNRMVGTCREARSDLLAVGLVCLQSFAAPARTSPLWRADGRSIGGVGALSGWDPSLSFSRPRGTWRPLPSSNGPLAAAVLASSRAAALPPPSSFGPGESVSE
jgi:hypothetical protein